MLCAVLWLSGCATDPAYSWRASQGQKLEQVLVWVASQDGSNRSALTAELTERLKAQGVNAVAGDQALEELVKGGRAMPLMADLRSRHLSHVLLVSEQRHNANGLAPERFAPLWVVYPALYRASEELSQSSQNPLAGWQMNLYDVASSRMVWASQVEQGTEGLMAQLAYANHL
ncbi:hypothetical protein B3C1_04645 [Gallaecimonas xiamenensis 3-C-1]|uniref:Uncharacterized protein n=2 Tax=Gallaecimonas TaxID=745410 RepID=K2JNV5_9GAMM|nr:hypothetical protein B3C1_04645 [Gallaecimonas xiamenensis 3-C-1]